MSASAIPVYAGAVYPGLRPFRPDEKILFFGREEQTDELLRRLQDTRFLAIVGLSGTGKSSLVQAGLIPSLERGNLAASGTLWRFATMKPGLDPLAAAIQALNKTLGESPARTAALRGSRLGLLEASRSGRQPNENLLFVVDQFEELFRFQRDQADRSTEAQEFVALLLAAAREYSADFPIYIVLTMRSDYLGECARFPGLVQALNEGQYLAEPMTRSQWHDVIVGPAGLADVTIEPALVEYLLDTAVGQQDQLPVLQHSLMRLWNIRDGQTLTLAEYNGPRVGGWDHALDIHANDVLSYVPQSVDNGAITTKIFQRLTEKGEENRENRRPTKLSELAAVANCTLDQARAVVNYFRADQCNFLTSQDAHLTADSVIDISHESLIRRWQALKKWSKDEVKWGDWYQRVEDRLRINGELSASELDAAAEIRAQAQWNQAWAERYRTEKNGIKPAYADVVHFLDTSQENLRREVKRRKQRAILAISLAIFFAALAAAAGYFWWSAKQAQTKAQTQLIRNDWQFSREEQSARHLLESLQWAAEAIDVNPKGAFHNSILLDVRDNMPRASLNAILRHDNAVSGASFNRDASRILTWSRDNTARLWDARTGIQIGPALKHDAAVSGAVLSKDESRILSWSEDKTARLWNARTGSQIGPSLKHNAAVNGAVFSKDGSRILTWSADNSARLWDVHTGLQLAPALDHRGHEYSESAFALLGGLAGALFCKDESRILTWSFDRTARLWDARTASQVSNALEHQTFVFGAIPSNDGNRILTWSSDGIAQLWDARTGNQIASMLNHWRAVSHTHADGALFSKDDSRILTWSSDNAAQLWNARTGSQIGVFKHDNDVNGASFSKDESRILTWSSDKTARLWDARTGSQIGSALKHEGSVLGAEFSKDERLILTWSSDHTARLWDAGTASQLGPELKLEASVGGPLFSTEGTSILTWSDKTVRQWEIRTGRQSGSMLEHEGSDGLPRAAWAIDHDGRLTNFNENTQIDSPTKAHGKEASLRFYPQPEAGGVFSKDQTRILTWSYSGAVELWDARTRTQIFPALNYDGWVNGALFSKDGSRILTSSSDKTARLWDVRTGRQIGPALKHDDAVNGAVFSKDESRIVTWSSDKTARLWDVRTRSQIGPALKHDDAVDGAVFSKDESRILTWSSDKTARLWDARAGNEIGPALKHEVPLYGAAFSKDESRILTWSFDRTARLWDAQTGNQLGSLIMPVDGAKFAKDETHLFTWGSDHTARLWDISADLDFPADQFKTLVQALTGVELDVTSQQLKNIEPARWRTIRDQYNRTASAHALVCKYPTANQWLLFHPH